MKFVLLVGHGSRVEEGNEEIRAFADRLIRDKSLKNAETCFLEFGKPDISEGIATCIQKGASEVVLVPVILLPAGHSKIHIPEAIDAAKIKYPNVKFRYTTPVGTDHRISQILSDRLGSRISEKKINPGDSAVIIVGRGSSDPDANSTLYKISRLFWEAHQFNLVETAFMGITKPELPETIHRCIRLGAKNIFILPYFLFTGILIERMKGIAEDFNQKNETVNIRMAEYFGFHPLLEDIIMDKIREAGNEDNPLNCDLCHFRLHHHSGHSHHHHH